MTCPLSIMGSPWNSKQAICVFHGDGSGLCPANVTCGLPGQLHVGIRGLAPNSNLNV